jgi:hypothetical protein
MFEVPGGSLPRSTTRATAPQPTYWIEWFDIVSKQRLGRLLGLNGELISARFAASVEMDRMGAEHLAYSRHSLDPAIPIIHGGDVQYIPTE